MIELHPDKHPEDREDPVKVKHWNDESAKVTEAQLTLGDAAKVILLYGNAPFNMPC